MNTFSLRYFNHKLESQYQKEASQHRLKILTRFMLLQNSFLAVIQTYLTIADYNYFSFSVLCGPLLFFLVILFLQRKKSSLLFPILVINYLSFIVYYIEAIRIYCNTENGFDNSIVLVIPLQFMHSMVVFMKFQWKHFAFLLLGSFVYFFLRIIDVREEKFMNSIVFFLLASWILQTYIAYDQEKHFKEYYKERIEIYEKANFQLIINNIIPSSIFIVSYETSEIKFSNNSGKKLINSQKNTNEKTIFIDFERFLKKYIVLQENPDSFESLSIAPDDLNATIKIYYNDYSKPFLNISEDEHDIEESFFRINVCSSECYPEKPKQSSSKCYYEIKIVKIFWEDKICLLLLFNDNTNVFRISELMSLDLYKNQLLASISHDLRTPLNGINGMLEVLSSKINDTEISSFIDLAKKSSCFLNYLINDILDFSLMNYKKMRLNIEEISLENVIQHVFSLMEFQAKEKKIELKFINLCTNLVSFFSDATRIEQILFNLLSNAIKFTHTGGIQIILADFINDYQKPLYKLSVKDTGIGIKTEDFGKLYRLFGRLEDQDKINKTGIGLGLTISKKISCLLCPEKPEGLQVESVYGTGSTFYFYLSDLNQRIEQHPKEEFDSLEYLEEKCSFNHISRSMPTKFFDDNLSYSEITKLKIKILVADDDMMNLMVIEQYLKLFNLGSIRAMNGLEAYKIIKNDLLKKRQEICMIIMDCNMPVLDGFQASVKINKYCLKKGKNKIPILAVTANTTFADVLQCKKNGMDYFLEKPIKKTELKKTLQMILDIKIEEIKHRF